MSNPSDAAISRVDSTHSLNGEWQLYRSPLRPMETTELPSLDAAEHVGIGHVPGNVHLDLGFSDLNLDTPELISVNDSEWLYVRSVPTPDVAGSVLLHFDGVDYFCDVWVNGTHAGHHEGYYSDWEVDVTALLRPAGETNEVILGISMPWRVDERAHVLEPATCMGKFAKHTEYMRGMFQLWWDVPLNGYAVLPFGPWRDISMVVRSGPTLTRMSGATVSIDERSARVRFDLEWWSDDDQAQDVGFDLRIAPDNFDGQAVEYPFVERIEPGRSETVVEIVIDDPELWWTWDTGSQHLYRAEALGASTLFGIREVVRDPDTLVFMINGVRTFGRGTWLTPPDVYSSRPDEVSLVRDIEMLRDANMNHAVIFSHVQQDAYYEAFDRTGILAFQELPLLQFGPMSLVDPAHPRHRAYWDWSLGEIESIVKRVRGHASLAVWGAFAEVLKDGEWVWDDYGPYSDAIAAIVGRLDPDTDYHPSFCDYGEQHIWQGGHAYEEFTDHYGRNEKYISEFGSQAPPVVETLRDMIPAESFWDVPVKEGSRVPLPIDVEDWSYVWGYDYPGLTINIARAMRWVDRKVPTPERFVDAAQWYQAFGYRYCAEIYRRGRYNRFAGARAWAFRMSQPSASASVVDHLQRPKMAYHELAAAYEPIQLQVDDHFPLAPLAAGATWTRDVWLINDLQAPRALTVTHALLDVSGTVRTSGSHSITVAGDGAEHWPITLELPEAGVYQLRLTGVDVDGAVVTESERWLNVAPVVVAGAPLRVLVLGQSRYNATVTTALGGVGGVDLTVIDETNRYPQDSSWAEGLAQRYDAIWFSGWDMASTQFTTTEFAAIADAVRAGVGFIHTGGQASFHGFNGRAALLDRTPLADVIPLRMRPHDTVVDRWPAIDDSGLVARYGVPLQKLPSYGGFARTTAAPSTEVLAEIGGFPLLASGTAGAGRTVAFTGGLTRWHSTLKETQEQTEFGEDVDIVPRPWETDDIRDYEVHWLGNLGLFLTMLQLATGRDLAAAPGELADRWLAPTFEVLAELEPTTLKARVIASAHSADTGETRGVVEVTNTGGIVARLVRGVVDAPTTDSRFRDGFVDLMPGGSAQLRFEARCTPDLITGLTLRGQNGEVTVTL